MYATSNPFHDFIVQMKNVMTQKCLMRQSESDWVSEVEYTVLEM